MKWNSIADDGNHCHNGRRSHYDLSPMGKSDCEEFSDDSLEGLSLPPPPPPHSCVPPSMSEPVTPIKRGSIAWEINLDDCSKEHASRSAGVAQKFEKVRT